MNGDTWWCGRVLSREDTPCGTVTTWCSGEVRIKPGPDGRFAGTVRCPFCGRTERVRAFVETKTETYMLILPVWDRRPVPVVGNEGGG